MEQPSRRAVYKAFTSYKSSSQPVPTMSRQGAEMQPNLHQQDSLAAQKGRQTVHTGDINVPKPSPGPLLRPGKAWEGLSSPGIKGLGWSLQIWVEAPLWTHLGTAELGTGVI